MLRSSSTSVQRECGAARRTTLALPRVLLYRAQSQAAQPPPRAATTVRAVKFDAELQALLEGAMARSSCTVGDRVGIIGLKFAEEGRKEDCPVVESAIRLGCYLRDYQAARLRGSTILELGTGIGVAGLTAAAFGANVLLTDLPELVPVAAKNVAKNSDLVRGAGGLAQVAPLDWAAPAGEVVAGPWEYIIGSDLVYDDRSPDVLAPLLQRLLAANPRAAVYLAHLHRSGNVDDLMTAAFERHGLALRAAPRDEGDHPEQDISIITVHAA
ncbi:Methyltransferase-like protein 21B [Tetrabaena socialis]|uniref:Methyltransferase-like protein 21B n=1 Tax=Tetrabaena socialis TaxID=47790 RepID=A0A2J8A2F9_9CHLO|nr:Methyltransferase-like protein 21B [Tetrabaena socialis]|eukprot:PNH06695.1 Methyltransferase-like protein 21B [Tetrabaena socialis]